MATLGFYKQATQRRPDDEPFLCWGPPFMTGDGQKMVHFGPKMAKHGRLVNVPQCSKRDQNGQPKSFWTFGTLLGPSGPFWTISNKNWYFAPKHLCKTLFCPFGAKKSFLSEMVQKGPDDIHVKQESIPPFLRTLGGHLVNTGTIAGHFLHFCTSMILFSKDELPRRLSLVIM